MCNNGDSSNLHDNEGDVSVIKDDDSTMPNNDDGSNDAYKLTSNNDCDKDYCDNDDPTDDVDDVVDESEKDTSDDIIVTGTNK